MPPWVTLTLLAINVGVFALGTLLPVVGRQLFQIGASRSYEVLVQGEVQRLFTAMFLHAGMMHLFFNMYALYIIGRGVEGLCGHARFLLIYLPGRADRLAAQRGAGLAGPLAERAFGGRLGRGLRDLRRGDGLALPPPDPAGARRPAGNCAVC